MYMKLIAKYFLIRYFRGFGGGALDLDKHFPLADTIYLGIILKSSCIQVNMVSSFCSPSDVTSRQTSPFEMFSVCTLCKQCIKSTSLQYTALNTDIGNILATRDFKLTCNLPLLFQVLVLCCSQFLWLLPSREHAQSLQELLLPSPLIVHS